MRFWPVSTPGGMPDLVTYRITHTALESRVKPTRDFFGWVRRENGTRRAVSEALAAPSGFSVAYSLMGASIPATGRRATYHPEFKPRQPQPATPEYPMTKVLALPAPATLYPALAQVQPSLDELHPAVAPMSAPSGTVLFSENAPCQGFPLVLDGEIKVSSRSGDGRTLELYRVVPGELCLVSSASLFRTQPLSAHGITTKASTLLLIPPGVFMHWLQTPVFRDAVLGLFAERMADLTSLIDAVAFHRLDQRLAAALLGRGQNLALTHQALADELGTVREIISRLLRRFEREGWVELARERIHIRDSAALRAVAAARPPEPAAPACTAA